ncbi:MAG: hypothetical protein ACI9Z4_001170 [Polaribacter sp.]|jgi:hypothetical protein
MNKFEEKVSLYKKYMEDKNLNYNADLLVAVTRGLGPCIYKVHAEVVSETNSKELATVKNNFLVKKLGMSDNKELEDGIEAVMEKIGKSERKKYRAVVYYLLVEEFNKESVYMK